MLITGINIGRNLHNDDFHKKVTDYGKEVNNFHVKNKITTLGEHPYIDSKHHYKFQRNCRLSRIYFFIQVCY